MVLKLGKVRTKKRLLFLLFLAMDAPKAKQRKSLVMVGRNLT